MKLQFSKAKDGTQTFSADGVFFHSTYSPYKEAERFIQGVNFLFEPKIVFFIEPGLSYCKEVLKKKYPQCQTACIRLFNQKLGDEANWDYLIHPVDYQQLKTYLINNFGEEKLLSSTIVFPKITENIFFNEVQQIVNEYKSALEDSKTLLVTRQFFEKKWLINSCTFLKYINNIIKPDFKTELPVVICASGPSLEQSISIIKQYRNKVFILCLSSALSVLIKHSIIPDLLLSTDGGYWAGEHLKYLKQNPGIPLAAPCEAFIPKEILQNNPILALRYNDDNSFICSSIFVLSKIPFQNALRNPTVSGTGLFLAKNITSNNIFFCGLDLSSSNSFQHSQPNELEKNNLIFDTRIKSKQTRINRSRFNSDSLAIYRNWFSSLNEQEVKNVKRVIIKNTQKPLGNITDIDNDQFQKIIANEQNKNNTTSLETTYFDKLYIHKTFAYIINNLSDEKWQKQIFPADYLSLKNNNDEQAKQLTQARLNKRVQALIKKVRTIADE